MVGPLWRAFANMVGPKAEIIKSVSGALGRRFASIEFGLAAIAFG